MQKGQGLAEMKKRCLRTVIDLARKHVGWSILMGVGCTYHEPRLPGYKITFIRKIVYNNGKHVCPGTPRNVVGRPISDVHSSAVPSDSPRMR